jgi:hypothetical protein
VQPARVQSGSWQISSAPNPREREVTQVLRTDDVETDVVVPIVLDEEFESLQQALADPAQVEAIEASPRALPAWLSGGSLQQFPVAQALTALMRARATGRLELRDEESVAKYLYVVDGRITSAVSGLSADRFGVRCVRSGVVSADRARELSVLGGKLRHRLVDAGILTREEGERRVQEQVVEIVLDTLGWKSGSLRFVEGLRQPEADVPFTLYAGNLIFRHLLQATDVLGLRQVLPLQRVLFPVAEPTFELHDLTLTDTQARMLIACDGTKTVKDLLQISNMSEPDTRVLLRAFESLGLVEERSTTSSARRVTFGLDGD